MRRRRGARLSLSHALGPHRAARGLLWGPAWRFPRGRVFHGMDAPRFSAPFGCSGQPFTSSVHSLYWGADGSCFSKLLSDVWGRKKKVRIFFWPLVSSQGSVLPHWSFPPPPHHNLVISCLWQNVVKIVGGEKKSATILLTKGVAAVGKSLPSLLDDTSEALDHYRRTTADRPHDRERAKPPPGQPGLSEGCAVSRSPGGSPQTRLRLESQL